MHQQQLLGRRDRANSTWKRKRPKVSRNVDQVLKEQKEEARVAGCWGCRVLCSGDTGSAECRMQKADIFGLQSVGLQGMQSSEAYFTQTTSHTP